MIGKEGQLLLKCEQMDLAPRMGVGKDLIGDLLWSSNVDGHIASLDLAPAS